VLTRSTRLTPAGVVVVISGLLAITIAPASAQIPPLTVSPLPDAPAWIRTSDPLRLALNRPVPADEGRLAVLVGETDWSGLTDVVGTSIAIRPARIGFPQGESVVVVYLVTSGPQWQEIGRSPLRVLTPSGFEKALVKPTAELGLTGQAAVGRTPPVPPTDRDTFQDLTVRTGLDATLVRNGWTSTSQAQVVGVNTRAQALRFATLQDNAPLVDLSSYRVGIGNGMATVSAGQATVGTHRLLLSSFATRGLSGSVRFGPVADLSLSAVNGSSIVGYGNLLGFTNDDHRIVNTTLGLELIPARRGALRVDASLLRGSVQPVTNVNQGAIRDPEESRGIGVQVRGSDAQSRVRLDAGVARSRFTNPTEPLSIAGATAIAGRETTRDARYLDFSYAVVQGAKVGANTANVTTGFRHSRVEPLYRSVALPVRADLEQNAVDITTALGAYASQLTYEQSRDNLADIASILTTRTRQLLWTNTLPLQGFAGAARRATLWPSLNYSLARTAQAGDGLPVGGLFDSLSQVPDQVSLNQSLGVAWQGALWRGGYAFNRSFQDNRQLGRERADLLNFAHVLSLGVAPSPRFDAGAEFALDRAENREFTRTDQTRRLSANLMARPANRTTVMAVATRNLLDDSPRSSRRQTTDINVTVTQSIALLRQRPNWLNGQFFVRYARQTLYGWLVSAEPEEMQFWIVNTGLSFRFF
jgi:hypothetical protein